MAELVVAIVLCVALVLFAVWLRARDRKRLHVIYGDALDRAAEYWGMRRHEGETDSDLRERLVGRITSRNL